MQIIFFGLEFIRFVKPDKCEGIYADFAASVYPGVLG